MNVFNRKLFVYHSQNIFVRYILSKPKCKPTPVEPVEFLDKTQSKTSNTIISENELESAQHFKIIYKFSYVQIARVVNRLKFQQTLLTGACVPTSFMLQQTNIISFDTACVSSSLCLFSCLALYTLGIVCNRIVGAIYVTPDAKTVKFSYLDFWGHRNDIICPVTDVLPLSELEGRVTDPYINLRQYSTPKKLRFSIRYGSIVDADNFKKVFGNIEE